MKWYFSFVLALVLLACSPPAKINIEEFRTTKRITYHAFLVEDFSIAIAEAKPTQLEDIVAAFPFKEDNQALKMPEGLMDDEVNLEAIVLSGERQDIRQSKVQYQRAFVQKAGDWWIVQTAFESEASGYTFADDLIEWGAQNAYVFGHASKDMGWYEFGGAQIDVRVEDAKVKQPDGWIVLLRD